MKSDSTERRKLQSITKVKALATMQLAWGIGMFHVSLAFITLSFCLEVSVRSEYYKIVRRDSTN